MFEKSMKNRSKIHCVSGQIFQKSIKHRARQDGTVISHLLLSNTTQAEEAMSCLATWHVVKLRTLLEDRGGGGVED